MHYDKPCAAPGLHSFRYVGRYGYIMIGARNAKDALNEAARSLSSGEPDIGRLQAWCNESHQYVSIA